MQNPFLFTSPAHPFSFTQAAQKTFPAVHFPCTGPFLRPWPNPAQRHTLPPCLTARRAPPVGSVSLPRPSRTQAQSPTRSRAPRRVSLGPARPGASPAPIKGTLDPLEIPSPKPQPPSSRTLACAAIAAPELGAPRRAAAPLRLLDDITAPKLRVEVRELSGSVFLLPLALLARFSSPAPQLRVRRRKPLRCPSVLPNPPN